MAFNSLSFLIFLGIVTLLWYLLPAKIRPLLLALASFTFYGIYSLKALIILCLYTAFVYGAGLLLDKKKSKSVLALVVIAGLLPLFVFKYLNFTLSLADKALSVLHLSNASHSVSLILPLGISYFSFKSLSYLIDVYKGKTKACKNVIELTAFVTFFPEMLVGPIDRADKLLVQIREKKAADWQKLEQGVMILVGGYFEKMVVADRLGTLVDTVYGNLTTYEGLVVILAACCYSLQIYFDFSGCTHMAIGIGKILGFDLPENFRQPYLAISMEDCWRRWHISLTSWLREYIYIPLGGNRKGKVRKQINVMIVFLVSGLWHGAGLSFIVWGGLNGLFQIIGVSLKGLKGKCYAAIHADQDSMVVIWIKRIGTFLLMTICWVFFRAESLSQAVLVFEQSFKSFNPWILFDGTLFELGLSQKNVYLLAFLLIIMLVYDLVCEHGHKPSEWLVRQHYLTKCLAFYLVVFAVIILGVYGEAQDWGNFIYAQF